MQSSLDAEVIASTTRGSFVEGMPFPEVVQRLSAVGVERYYADLVRAEKTFYGSNGESHREPFLGHWSSRPAATFDPHAISDALRRIQRGEIDYPRFLECITAAGCAFYTVHLEGRKTIYTGRDGESYVELFPPAK
jgi:uncharacterized protein YbcV (DUF1398 family)